MNKYSLLLLIFSMSISVCTAQDQSPLPESPPPGTRREILEEERLEKLRRLEPARPEKGERIFNKLERYSNALSARNGGFGLRMGNLATGSGFAVGPQYLRTDLAQGSMTFRALAIASFKQYYRAEARVGFPRVGGERLDLQVAARRVYAPSINYYGPGPKSQKGDRSNYRREFTSFDLDAGWRPVPHHLQIGGNAGAVLFRIGPGIDSRLASSPDIFGPDQAPGIDQPAGFLRAGPYLELDFRDHPGLPRKGGMVRASWDYYKDYRRERFSFHRVEGRIEYYIPFFNEKRLIALRGKTEISRPGSGQTVPFYLQPTLGGSDDLRGFRSFRFHDDHLLVLNAEYRWEVAPGLDMALFGDAGKVFGRLRDFHLRDLESSAGFGFRFKTRENVSFRLDTGFSREGFQIWFKFSDVF